MDKPRVNPKAYALELLSGVPDTATVEDLKYEFDLIIALIESQQDIEEGRTYSHEEVMAQVQELLASQRVDQPSFVALPPTRRPPGVAQ